MLHAPLHIFSISLLYLFDSAMKFFVKPGWNMSWGEPQEVQKYLCAVFGSKAEEQRKTSLNQFA